MDHVTVNVRTAVGNIALDRPVLAAFDYADPPGAHYRVAAATLRQIADELDRMYPEELVRR